MNFYATGETYGAKGHLDLKMAEKFIVSVWVLINGVVADDNEAPLWLIPHHARGMRHTSSHSCATACLWNHTRPGRLHTVDIDDWIQLHDYIFSQSFKWFIGMHLDGEHICRQYSGEVAARRRNWPVRSGGRIKNNEIQHLCQVEMSAGSKGGQSRWERVEDGGLESDAHLSKPFL